MTPRSLLVGILLPTLCFAQTTITEISPNTVGEEKEWFEFSIESAEEVPLANWKVSNGSTHKLFSDYTDRLTLHSGGMLSEELLFTPEEEVAYFSWTPSPLALPKSGGTIQILNENDELLDEIIYPTTKSGTSSGEPYSEIWNRREDTDELFPLIHRNTDSTLRHTKGMKNDAMPTFPDEVEVMINEISPNEDFVELQITNDANLKYLELKKKSSPRTVLHQLTDLNVETDELLTIDVPGLSGGSETFEVILYSGTSWEASEDFVCWQKGDISQNVASERDKKIETGAWSGDCMNIEDLIQSESRARNGSDTNTKDDFLRHYLGSRGLENTFPNEANKDPSAKFLVQGGAKIHETSLNLTGFDGTALTSTDPDGSFDIQSYQWEVDNASCGNYETDFWEWRQVRNGERSCEEESTRSNPDRIYFNFEQKSSFQVALTVTDYSGGTHTFSQALTKDPFKVGAGGAPSAFQSSLKKWIEKELTQKPRKAELREGDVSDDFFADFIATLDLNNLTEDYRDFSTFAPLEVVENPKPLEKTLFQKEKFSDQQKRKIEKNIGFIFLEPWCF
jgi:hypothetical protein